MKLKDYLQTGRCSPSQLANAVGVAVQSIYRYSDESRIPSREVMAKIVEVTGGAVTANDFYDIQNPSLSAGGPIPPADASSQQLRAADSCNQPPFLEGGAP